METSPGPGPEQPSVDSAVHYTSPTLATLDSTVHYTRPTFATLDSTINRAVCETLLSINSPDQTVDVKPFHPAPAGA